MIISALNALQITSLTLICIIITAIIAVTIICIIRAMRITPPIVSEVIRLDKFIADPAITADKLSKLIQHKTIASHDAIKHMEKMTSAQELIKQLFPNINSSCEYNDFNGGLLIKWSGLTSSKPLMLMSHLDVVSARGEWKIPAFDGIIQDGIIHGRGAVDTKGSLIAMLEAVDSLISDGLIPQRDVYIFASSREEIGGEDAHLVYTYLKEKGVYPYLLVDEGGAIMDAPLVGVKGKFAMIALAERASVRIVLTASSRGRTSGMARLANFIIKSQKLKLSATSFPPEVKAMFKTMTPHMNFPMRCLFANFPLFQDFLLGVLPKVSSEAKAMIGATLSFSPSTQQEVNRYPLGTATISATINATYYQDLDSCLEKFLNECTKLGITTHIEDAIRYTVAPEPLGSDGYSEVANCIRAVFPDVTPSPFILFGSTDSRHFVSLADSVIRFAPLHLTNAEFRSFHNINEQIHSQSIAHAVEFYRELILRIPALV